MADSDPTIPTTKRLAPKRLGTAAMIAGALLGGMVFMSLLQRQKAVETPPPPPLPPLYEVQTETDAFQRLQLKTSWAGEDRTPPMPVVKPTPTTAPPSAPLFAPQAPATTPPPLVAAPTIPTTPPPATTVPPMTSTPAAQPAQQPTPAKQQSMARTPERKGEDDWLFADIKKTSRKRQGAGAGSQSAEGEPGIAGQGGRGRTSQLFPAAVWERPARPTRVIYQSQMMQCMLEQAIKTGQDGTIRCRVTETLYDKFGQLDPLVPVYSLILGKVQGASVKPGQSVVPITVTKVELPDGTDLSLKGQMGGQDGISGVPATRIDNRIPQVILSAVLSAVASVGTRSITGSPQGYHYDIGQEATANAAQSLSRSGQEIIKRSLSIDPVIWVDAQTPVTVQLDSNVSLQTNPLIIHR